MIEHQRLHEEINKGIDYPLNVYGLGIESYLNLLYTMAR